MKLFVQLTSLALLATLALSNYSISKFEGLPFKVKPSSGMYFLGSLGFDDVTKGNQVLAYGDFNNDKFTDIVSLEDDGVTLTVFLYSHEKFAFDDFTQIKAPETVMSVIPGDYNYDGQLDLLINTLAANGTTQLRYYIRQSSEPYFSQQNQYSLDNNAQPFIFDVEGERKVDVLFMEGGVRKIQTLEGGNLQKVDFSQYVSKASGCLDSSSVIKNNFSTPHSNAFVDFNGDCAADLFITSVDANNNLYFEIWLMGKDSKFCLVDATQITHPSISAVSVGDMNNDGRIDLVFASIPSDSTSPMSLHVILNTLKANYETPCNSDAPIVPPFAAGAYNLDATTTDAALVSQITGPYGKGSRLFTTDPVNRPSKIRIGDINIDGYPDLLFVISDSDNQDTSYGSIVLSLNYGKEFEFTQLATDTDETGYYTLLGDGSTTDGNKLLKDVPALYASFFDFDELGRLGMWIVTPKSESSGTSMLAAFNFVNTENFILKTLGLNGVRPKDSDDVTTSLGGIYYGSSVECKVTDINGKASISKGSQMPQSAYTPLDLPYIFIGLGRTNNYVENFVMGIANSTQQSGDKQQAKWTPIIPNSQLIVNPIPRDDWTLDVYVNPTSETILIVITTLVILLLLGALIIYLHSKEKEEDNQSRDRWMRIGVA